MFRLEVDVGLIGKFEGSEAVRVRKRAHELSEQDREIEGSE